MQGEGGGGLRCNQPAGRVSDADSAALLAVVTDRFFLLPDPHRHAAAAACLPASERERERERERALQFLRCATEFLAQREKQSTWRCCTSSDLQSVALLPSAMRRRSSLELPSFSTAAPLKDLSLSLSLSHQDLLGRRMCEIVFSFNPFFWGVFWLHKLHLKLLHQNLFLYRLIRNCSFLLLQQILFLSFFSVAAANSFFHSVFLLCCCSKFFLSFCLSFLLLQQVLSFFLLCCCSKFILSFCLSSLLLQQILFLSFFLSSLLLLGCLITSQGKKIILHSLQILKSS